MRKQARQKGSIGSSGHRKRLHRLEFTLPRGMPTHTTPKRKRCWGRPSSCRLCAILQTSSSCRPSRCRACAPQLFPAGSSLGIILPSRARGSEDY
ncbi:hypothetical protein CC85DRAFT_24246 [Cutaneotrichosporon oleaginosum]|uniref:Uncharacterized protein n=1 Tax=Cutaneotrichosporon oleaginosum TaxID=879819 RepID=A0A0J0XT30_9TREE|nr:uncharacterized protein CC85DRAFT_24246 [Cutaneotrichosporon oleaginosum]KLT44236.1 hypothetical protein CC85DRAFT_24246 [Cutaneotrichosporon oleaginosum]TXT11596.1 hypothetical protein COLE_02006 [Cutaneotrichosporon oleaginosum]